MDLEPTTGEGEPLNAELPDGPSLTGKFVGGLTSIPQLRVT
jgi:hypothetical protein